MESVILAGGSHRRGDLTTLTPVILSHEDLFTGGGIADHVMGLARAVGEIRPSLSLHVIANADRSTSGYAKEDGINLHRISSWISGNNFLDWALVLNIEFVREATSLHRDVGISVLHAHDWTTVPAAVTMKLAHRIPFVLTIHSTERKRSGGIHSEYSHAIESIEAQGIREAAIVVVNDEQTSETIVSEFGAAREKVETIKPVERDWALRIASIYDRISEEGGLH